MSKQYVAKLWTKHDGHSFLIVDAIDAIEAYGIALAYAEKFGNYTVEVCEAKHIALVPAVQEMTSTGWQPVKYAGPATESR